MTPLVSKSYVEMKIEQLKNYIDQSSVEVLLQ